MDITPTFLRIMERFSLTGKDRPAMAAFGLLGCLEAYLRGKEVSTSRELDSNPISQIVYAFILDKGPFLSLDIPCR